MWKYRKPIGKVDKSNYSFDSMFWDICPEESSAFVIALESNDFSVKEVRDKVEELTQLMTKESSSIESAEIIDDKIKQTLPFSDAMFTIVNLSGSRTSSWYWDGAGLKLKFKDYDVMLLSECDGEVITIFFTGAQSKREYDKFLNYLA